MSLGSAFADSLNWTVFGFGVFWFFFLNASLTDVIFLEYFFIFGWRVSVWETESV